MMEAKLLFTTKHKRKKTMFNEGAEKLNGRAAMIGFVAAVGSYLATGQVIPGIW